LKFHLRHAEGSSRGSGSGSNFAGAGDSLFLTAAGGLLGSEGVIFRVATSIGFSLLPGSPFLGEVSGTLPLLPGTTKGDTATAPAAVAGIGPIVVSTLGFVVVDPDFVVVGCCRSSFVCTPPGELGRPAPDVPGIGSTVRVDSS
jgi:hypothetical protein